MKIMGAHIVFRADASVAIGTGHVMRCLTLANSLTRHGAKVAFVCTPETLKVVPRLSASGYEIAGETSGGDLLVLDHYGLGKTYEQEARGRFHRLMVIDDLPTRPHECDLLLDQTHGRTPAQWQGLVPGHARVLTGTDYLLLRPEFLQSCPPRQRLDTILVTLGGTDPGNVTEIALDGIVRSALDCAVHVVMGPQAPYFSAIQAKARTMHHVQVHTNVPHMAQLMIQSDLAIGAGGGTAWERCSLGLPAILLQIAANQKDVVQSLVAAGAAVESAIDAASIAKTLLDVSHAPDTLKLLSKCAQSLCTGDGTERVAQTILSMLGEHP